MRLKIDVNLRRDVASGWGRHLRKDGAFYMVVGNCETQCVVSSEAG